jgi:hypothetical protein
MRVMQRRAHARLVRRRRRAVVLVLLAVTVLLVGIDFARGSSQDAAPSRLAGIPLAVPSFGGQPGGDGSEPNGSTAGPAPTVEAEQVVPSQSSAGRPGPQPTVVQRGAGTFQVAPGTGDRVGSPGATQLLRFRVEVENGIGQSAASFAAAAEATLADKRSWISTGRVAFQRVSGDQYDFRLVMASPDTVDQLCFPLKTLGQVSCRQLDRVVINVARWVLGVPQFGGDIATYRQYVVNHEVGHKLGNNHVRCASPGTLAPVMQQQTYDLRSCRPNGWPYPDGKLLTGPSVSGS